MDKQRRYPPEVRECAVRMVLDHTEEHGSQWATICSIAGIEVFTLKLEGKIDEHTFVLHGYLVEQPGMKIIVRLTKRADLP